MFKNVFCQNSYIFMKDVLNSAIKLTSAVFQITAIILIKFDALASRHDHWRTEVFFYYI